MAGRGQGRVEDAHIKALLSAIPKVLECAEPPSQERIARFESMYDLVLPAAYRRMIERLGDINALQVPYRLLGLSVDRLRKPTTASVLAELRASRLNFPNNLLPVEVLPQSQVACIKLDGSADPPVVLVDTERPFVDIVAMAPSYSLFCLDWLSDVRAMDAILRHTRRLDRDILAGLRPADKAARPDDWRAYRFCSQDVLVGTTLLRYDRENNVTEVGAFTCATLTSFADDAPFQALLALVLADAYRSGGDLSLQFVADGGRHSRPIPIPGRVTRFAQAHNISLESAARGFVGPAASKQLFVECLTCSDGFRGALRDAQVDLDVAAVCFAVASGIWDSIAAEFLVRNAHNPTRAFRGGSIPLDTLPWCIDLQDASAGVLLSALFRRASAGPSLGSRHDVEDEARPVSVEFTDLGTVILSTEAPLALGWSWEGDSDTSRMEVLPVAAEEVALADRLPDLAVWLAENATDGDPCLLVPRDAERLLGGRHDQVLAALDSLRVDVLIAPLYTTTIAADAARRLQRARTSRQ